MEAESFDRKIRELLDGANFPYQEADWHRAQVLLHKERKRRGLWWLWLFPAIVGGAAWWMLMPTQAETRAKAELRMQAPASAEKPKRATSLPTETVESTSHAAFEEASLINDVQAASELAALPPVSAIFGEKRNAQAFQRNKKATDVLSSAAVDVGTPNFIPYLHAKIARLHSSPIEKPIPTTRPVEPFPFERPKVKPGSLLALGLYASSQPSWNKQGEKGVGSLNWQVGAFTSIQLSNGLYAQWLTGIQQQGLRNWTYSNTTTTYHFGYERTNQTLDLRDYWTFQNALQFGYAQGKHRFFAAITYQHYLLSRYRLSTQIERQDAPTATQTENGRAAWLQAGEQQSFIPGLGYQHELSPAFRLGLQYQFQAKQNGNYSLPAAAPWQFSLQYHLFQRLQP
jgi:hypothetical protein